MNYVNIGSDNGLSPVRYQAIAWTNAGLLSIRALGTIFNEILIEILKFSFMKMHVIQFISPITETYNGPDWINAFWYMFFNNEKDRVIFILCHTRGLNGMRTSQAQVSGLLR